MNLEDLEIGHSIELEVSSNNKKTAMTSTIEQKLESSVLLNPIRSDGKLVGFPPHCMVDILYSDREHAYCWRNVTVKAIVYKGSAYHSIELSGDAEIINRRAAYRVYMGERMTITTFTNEGPKNFEVLVKDISETGFAFFSTEALDVGRVVRLNMPMNEDGYLKLSSQIVRKQPCEERSDIIYGCRFAERNRLLSGYLMSLQQSRQKNKMGNNSTQSNR